MSEDLRQIIKDEYIACAKDPSHFMRKYCFIQHPQRGRVIFNLYPFQGKVLNLWRDNPYSIVLKSRQLGISTLAAGYSLWWMLFHKDKNVLCLATKQETAKNMVTKWGLSDKLGTVDLSEDESNKMFNTKSCSEATSQIIDEEVKRIIQDAYNKAKDILLAKNNDLHLLAKALLEHETLTGDQIKTLLAGGEINKQNQEQHSVVSSLLSA